MSQGRNRPSSDLATILHESFFIQSLPKMYDALSQNCSSGYSLLILIRRKANIYQSLFFKLNLSVKDKIYVSL